MTTFEHLQYDNWPRSVRIAYCCTFPVSCPVLMLSMMLGTIFGGLVLVLMVTCVAILPKVVRKQEPSTHAKVVALKQKADVPVYQRTRDKGKQYDNN